MRTHLGLMFAFSLLVSIVFAVLLRDEPTAQLRLGVGLLLGFVGGGLLLSWLLYPLPL